jgi:MFS family permease
MGRRMAEEEDPQEISPAASPVEGPAETGNEVEQVGDGAPLKKELSLPDQDHSSTLSRKELALISTSLLFAIFLSSFEQNSVSTTLPGIARDFGSSTSISWVGTAFLVTNTSSQVIYSRLSDIFGRKILLIITIAMFSLGNLLCGFAKNLAQLIVFRAIAGYGGGGIMCLVLIIVSDIVSLKERGKVARGLTTLILVPSVYRGGSSRGWCSWSAAWRCLYTISDCIIFYGKF